MFKLENCSTVYGPINCKSLSRHLSELYSGPIQPRIPYSKAVYIAAQQEKGAALLLPLN